MAFFRTPPLQITDVPADTDHYGGAYDDPQFIFLHHTGGVDSTAYLSTTPGSSVSCNRLVKKDGENIKIVRDGANAWTQGLGVMGPFAPGDYMVRLPNGGALQVKRRSNLNKCGLSIEIENLGNGKDPYPMAQLAAVADQVVEWWGLYGFLPILAHWHVDSRKTDPRAFPWDRLYELIWQRLKVIAVGDE